MPQFTRRGFFGLLGAGAVASAGLVSYAVGVEPRFRLSKTRYELLPPGWPADQPHVRIAVLADLHAVEPWMPLQRIAEIVSATNDLKPDVTVLLGDFVAGVAQRFRTGIIPPAEWAAELGKLKAPLGTYAILGNHDWWRDPEGVRTALQASGIPVLENDALRLEPAQKPAFWLAGLGDQWALRQPDHSYKGVDDLPGTLAQIPEDGTPIVLMAHEPDIFPLVPDRVSLTLCGHTHGGQVDLPFVGALVVPSKYGPRYLYGQIVEDGRHLIVSGGLGCTWLPVRFGVPPEIVVVDLGTPPVTGA